MEEETVLGVMPEHEPLFRNENWGVVMAIAIILALEPNIDIKKLKTAIHAIEKDA